ncbi:ATPase, T2SS/T4P/T4SS family [Paucibacter sp. APW11]|uniref:ATPase, T2SS/T4P/T4SS family n=1 Tax=Roseateles aquae TaxID=3077235 RepID=A0ABU3PFE9_9BURK|nr:ATPase, T2SS/T4P/T4SS family [Paucibacter sp. APW11]MDT9001244.1 ATPase, T2SS/T4P/T4SS family [Paucibacter sp. APW11]
MTEPMFQEQRLGELLLTRGLITAADLERALAVQGQYGVRLGKMLVRLGAISEDSLLPVLADQLATPLLSEEEFSRFGADAARTADYLGIDRAWFVERELLVFESSDGVIHCASRQPQDSFVQETLAAASKGHELCWRLLRTRDAEAVGKFMLRQEESGGSFDDVAHLREMAEEAPVIDLVNGLLAQAADVNASDIHVEPEEREFFVRFRVDGVLQTRGSFPSERFAAVASRIKLVSGLDIAERRLPQDGRITLRVSGVDMDVRVSVVPGVHGESIVMRLLPKDRGALSLERLGMEADHLQLFRRWLKEPNGIVLVTGPTGSGKSTTLYGALAEMNDREGKIITVEDPVEYRMKGVTQIQTQAEIGYTFSRALRAVLRQDPDVIMIGEVRDLETAEIAVQSALTGHLVFSTLHTNDALSAFTRLIDMGVEPFLVASSVRAVEAQRLVRRLCPQCATPVALSPAFADMIEAATRRHPQVFDGNARWRAGAGCSACHHTGYRGRLGVYELVMVTPAMQSAIMQRRPAQELIDIALAGGYRSLWEDALIKAWRGETSLDEVLRIAGHGSVEGI